MDLYLKTNKPNEITNELIDKIKLYTNDPHTVQIKQEYIKIELSKATTNQDLDQNTNNNNNNDNHSSLSKNDDNNKESNENDDNDLKHQIEDDKEKCEPRAKKFKRDSKSKNEQRKAIRKQREIRLCPAISKCERCEYGDKCKYSHDVASYLQVKGSELGTKCYRYQTYGYCPFGLSCRFSSDHTYFNSETQNYENKVNSDLFSDQKVHVFNALENSLKTKLWKKNYDFKRTNKICDIISKYVDSNKSQKYDRNKGIVDCKTKDEVQDEDGEKNNSKKLGSVTDEDIIKLRSGEKKVIDWKNKLYLAPLTTVGNLPFRRICKEFGADITCCEMAMSTNLLTGQASEWSLLKRHESEDLFGVQLAGSYADSLTKTCQIIAENKYKVDFVDLNCGCPIDLVFNKGAGCALMTRLSHFEKIVRSLDTIVDVPVTVKIRTGIKDDLPIAHSIVPKIKDWGVSMITLHGRTRNQRYSKLADWNYIDECAQLSDPVPLFGCGDILSYHDYNDHMTNTKISGCMIARGALYKPWIFSEIKEQRDWDISAAERFDLLKKFTNYGLEHWGSDTQGVETTRRFLLEWLSFLYRYIPVGILEHVPQKLNLRPPPFFCRNELENLLSSPNCSDWIKISELLLGRVPEGFQFTPKHKANAF